MNGQALSFMYVLNIIMQALFSLLFVIALFVGIGYAATLIGAPDWVYIPLILTGVALGIISMVRFIITAMAGLERLEEQRNKGKDK